ncbi:rCG21827, isoform CRA_b [Rattus norvegicus]|uniref:RCG21827, isoform CRA_b n=1 Tax=Rattus norvegicus TaxID=10116 RepID=A6J0U7_RAT|nr:rCG21827, isoform CRA_b [Rattus norvegicus]
MEMTLKALFPRPLDNRCPGSLDVCFLLGFYVQPTYWPDAHQKPFCVLK